MNRGVPSKAKDPKYVLRHLFKYIKQFRFAFLVVILLTILSSAFQLIGPFLSGMAIDEIDISKKAVKVINMEKVIFYCILMLAFYVTACLFSILINKLMINISKKIVFEMRKDLFHKLVELPVSFYDTNKIGDIISRMSYDIDTINTSLSTDVVAIISSVLSVVGSFAMMIVISRVLILTFVVTIPISIYVVRRRAKLVRPLFSARSRKNGELNAFVEEITSGHKTIKTYHKEVEIFNEFMKVNEEVCEATYLAEYHGFINGPIMSMINNIGLSLISVLGAILYLYNQITLGNINNFITYSKKFQGPINEVANIYADIQSAISAGERVFTLMDTPSEVADRNDAVALDEVKGNVEFKNVSFGYLPNKTIIKNLNMEVKEGEIIAIVGPTGAGKTTLINLLMRFYDVNDGEILLDGKNVLDIKRASLRKAYSMVLQDTWLFNGTIYENVSYGKPGATIDDVVRVCKDAFIHEYISRLPNGYNTYLSEQGSNISKGQKQLLTIARAMLLDSKMLILDEATSNVDTLTEIKINDAMTELMKNKTCFIIAHRLSTIMNADKIIVVNNGEIVECGKHTELLKQNGFYAKLYNSQFE